MFYPELSPAMRWHLDHNQKMYNMQMFSHQFSDKFSDQYGKTNLLYLLNMSIPPFKNPTEVITINST